MLVTTSLSTSGSGKIDLADNRLIVDYTVSNPVASIRDAIILARGPGGTWLGPGITSSSAAASPGARGVGYAIAGDVLAFSNDTAIYAGEVVDPTCVLVRCTALGDANLNGSVDFRDLVTLAQNYNTTVSGTTASWWSRGDFDYDGVVGFADLVKLAQNYNAAFPANPIPGAPEGFGSDLAAAFAPVPEPSTAIFIALAACGMLSLRSSRSPGPKE